MSDKQLVCKACSGIEVYSILTQLKYYPTLPASERNNNNKKKSLSKISSITHLQTSCSKTAAEQQDTDDATAAFPTPLTAEFNTEKKNRRKQQRMMSGGAQRPVHSGETLCKMCQHVIAEHIGIIKRGLSGASCFCFLMVMDSAEMLMFALKALSAIFCSPNNSLF